MIFRETETVELKRTLSKDFVKEVVAFLNTRDGTIYIGVDDNGKVVGISNVDKVMREVRDIIRDQILPTTEGLCEISSTIEENKLIIIVKVKKGPKLYYIKKEGRSTAGCFYRDGAACTSLSEDEIERRFIGSLNYKRTQLCEIPIIRNDLTFETLKDKLRHNGVRINEKTFLRNFNLVTKDGKYNLLADLLSDENRISLAVCVFKGKDKTQYHMRNEYGEKSLISAYKDALDYCKATNPTYVDVTVRPRREKKMFDEHAFEEAWINAIAHNLRDTHISPQIYIYEDRLEIESQGGIPYDLTEEEFLSGVSKPVNPDLMAILKSCHIVDRSGHGVPDVTTVYGKNAYKFSKNTIIVTIPFDKQGFDERQTLNFNQNSHAVNVNNTVNTSIHDSTLLKNEELVINALFLNNELTIKEISKETKLSQRTVSRTINSLKAKGLIERFGSDKFGYWKINHK